MSDAIFRLWNEAMPWTQILYEGTIFDAEHDDRKLFPIFENFDKSLNKLFPTKVFVFSEMQFLHNPDF